MVIACWKPVLEEADVRRIAERIGEPTGEIEVVYYPAWLLTIEVVRRLPFLGASRLLMRGIADGVSGKIAVLGDEVTKCEVDADPSRIVDTRLEMDSKTQGMLEERFLPSVLTRFRTASVAPSVRIVHAEHIYRKIFRAQVIAGGGSRMLYVDTATREYACLPVELISRGEPNDAPVILGIPDMARDRRPS